MKKIFESIEFYSEWGFRIRNQDYNRSPEVSYLSPILSLDGIGLREHNSSVQPHEDYIRLADSLMSSGLTSPLSIRGPLAAKRQN